MSNLFKNLPDPNASVEKTEAEKLAEAVKPVVAATPAQPAVTAPVVTTTAPVESEVEETDEEEAPPQMDELSMLKKRADLMNVKYSNNIGIDALKAKINSKLNNEADNTDADGVEIKQQNAPEKVANTTVNNTLEEIIEPERQVSLREYMQKTQMKLIRLRITNLDPKKKDLPGEIITVANEYLGTVKKFVPFGEVTDGGYHVPECIYNVLKERTFVSIKTRKGPRGQTIVENQDAREFSLEVLPPLSATELAQLATAQQAKGGLETD